MASQEEDIYYDGQKIYYNLEELERSLALERVERVDYEDEEIDNGPSLAAKAEFNLSAPPEHEYASSAFLPTRLDSGVKMCLCSFFRVVLVVVLSPQLVSWHAG